jgi:phosphocarrier protein HPr
VVGDVVGQGGRAKEHGHDRDEHSKGPILPFIGHPPRPGNHPRVTIAKKSGLVKVEVRGSVIDRRKSGVLKSRGLGRTSLQPPDPMPQIEIVVTNKLGLHARPAAIFVRVAMKFDAEIFVSRTNGDVSWVNAKSVMGVMSLGAAPGAVLLIRATGPDAEKALKSLRLLADKRFLEDHYLS